MSAHDRDSGKLSEPEKARFFRCINSGVPVRSACRRFNIFGPHASKLLKERAQAQETQGEAT